MDLLDQPATLVLLGIIFLFGGLGVFKLLRPPSMPNDGKSAAPTDDQSGQSGAEQRDEDT